MVCGSKPVKRHRRTKADMNGIAARIAEATASDSRMTVRQIFYCLLRSGTIEE